MESRISELEVKLGLAEEYLEELNRSAFRQQQQIDLMQAQLRELYRLLQPSGDAAPTDPLEEKPPHY